MGERIENVSRAWKRRPPCYRGAMCNLYRLRSTENLSRIFSARPLADQPELKLDTYPKYDACVIRREEGERVIEIMAWGIIATMKGKSGKPISKPVTNVRDLDSP